MLGTLVWVHYMNLNFYITFVITFNVLTLLEGIWPCRNYKSAPVIPKCFHSEQTKEENQGRSGLTSGSSAE